jgi:hypothetical protein
MGTIVQEYGPIYGEVVNGTVQGRPNGSVYVPISNSISIDILATRRFVRTRESLTPDKYDLVVCNSAGQISWVYERPEIVAVSQDLANNIQLQVADIADFSNIIGVLDFTAGMFNVQSAYIAKNLDSDVIVADSKYYVRAVLMANSTPVAVSSSIELTGVAE